MVGGRGTTRPPPERRGLRIMQWYAEAKRNRQPCACRAQGCGGNIDQRSVRVRSAANTTNCQWYHPACVEGGLGPFEAIENTGSLEPRDADVLRGFCDQPGKLSRAEYVRDMRDAKRVKVEGVDPGGAVDTLCWPPILEKGLAFQKIRWAMGAASFVT